MNRLVLDRIGALMGRSLAKRDLHTTLARANMVPIVIDGEGRHERAYDIYSRLLRDRIICVMFPINDHVASLIIAQLLFLQSDS
uniref:ATP-dependent Clp protease proteolytic subunit n=1 Tax=Plectus sambesii TaxID=2011161 RepID=A0A914V4C3_9BILA